MRTSRDRATGCQTTTVTQQTARRPAANSTLAAHEGAAEAALAGDPAADAGRAAERRLKAAARYAEVRTYALSRASAEGGPAHDIIAQHRPAARHEVVLGRVVQRPPAIALVHRPGTGALVLPEPGPPALPVPLVPLFALALKVGRAGRLGDVGQGDGTAAPSARAVLGEPVLGEHPQRGRHCRRAQPGRPGDLGAAGSLRAEGLVHQRGRAAEHQERRVRRLDAASSPTPPADTVRVPVRDPERVAVGPGQLADAHQVDQRVRLVTEHPQDAGHRPVAQRGVQGQVPRAELDHA